MMLVWSGKGKDYSWKELLKVWIIMTRPIEQLESGDFNLRKN